MTTRLIALVMLPVTVMCGLAGAGLLSSRSSAAHVMAVDRAVARLTDMVALRDALSTLEATTRFDIGVADLGLNRAAVIAALGFDWTVEVVPAREQADHAIVELRHDSPVSGVALRSLSAKVDSGTIGAPAALQELADDQAASAAATSGALASLGDDTPDAALRAALLSLQTSIGMADTARVQGADLVAVDFPMAGTTPLAAAAGLARLVADGVDYTAAAAQLRRLGVKSVVASLDRIETDPQVRRFERAATTNLGALVEAGAPLQRAVTTGTLGMVSTTAGAPLDVASVAAAFRGSFRRDDLLSGLVVTAAAAAREEARDLAASHRLIFGIGALAAAALALASIGIALWLARSISRPLKRLAGYAHAVNDGQLNTEPPPSGATGPRETSVVFSAFRDLVTNLQLLDAKANALATCNFDDPVLHLPLPGRIGRSLESSVTLLSGSIAERSELQAHLAYQATHDALTGISNRPAAIAAIQAAINRGARMGATTAVLFVDLSEFKSVNDSHGHDAGDEVLRQVASRLALALRGGDSVARLGGDEFVVIAEGVADVADVTALARRLIDAISEPIAIGRHRVTIGAAVGIALSLDGPEEPLGLLGRADAAMYRAKHHDRSAIEIFDDDLQHQLLEREDISTALAVALADPAGGGLQLYYQPVIGAASGAMVGAEALIRWDRPGHGVLAPDSFIPIAEQTALIVDVDRWVLAEAGRQLVAWSTDAILADIPVAVNISGRHLLSRRLPGHIRAMLDQTGIDPHRLTIEVTETVLLADLVSAAAELDAVRAMGIRVAIDDFGTGYTSLAHLQQLPIDTIKIDRSFIGQLNIRRGSSLVRMVTDLGHAIDVNIVAEGVETTEEMTALQAMGADRLQGYLLCGPLEPAAFASWAHSRTPAEFHGSALA